MHPQNAMLETAQELRSARPRTGEPNATFGCTEATTAAWPHFHMHSINASVGPSPDEATTATWRYQRDQQYSITAVTTSSGSVAERYAYTTYGQPTILDGSGSVLSSSAINNRYTYTGREWDQTLGLYHFRARWMSGLAGRFITKYPIKYFAGMNIYAFVAKNPLYRMDPSGLYWDEPEPKKVDVKDFCYRYRKCFQLSPFMDPPFVTAGCIGVVRACVGKGDLFDKETECFSFPNIIDTMKVADAAMAAKKCSKCQFPAMFSYRYWKATNADQFGCERCGRVSSPHIPIVSVHDREVALAGRLGSRTSVA